jgi:hypothetical protein
VGPACRRLRSWLCRQNTVLPGVVALTRFLGVEINEIYLQIFYTNEYNFADESIESNQFMIYYTNHLLIMKLNVSCSSHKLTQDCVGSFVTVFI